VLLRTTTCDRNQWLELAALARDIPHAMEKTIIEHALDGASDAGAPARVATSLEFAHVAGFRHLAVAEVNAVRSLSNANVTEQLRRVISIETFPVKR
jgi:hypothetical protein